MQRLIAWLSFWTELLLHGAVTEKEEIGEAAY
jgi:hypothetical protein